MEKSDNQDWFNKRPWYNIAIYSRLNGSMSEYFITHAITNRYNLLCSIVAHDKKQPAYGYYDNSIGDRIIPKQVKTEALEALGDKIKGITQCF